MTQSVEPEVLNLSLNHGNSSRRANIPGEKEIFMHPVVKVLSFIPKTNQN